MSLFTSLLLIVLAPWIVSLVILLAVSLVSALAFAIGYPLVLVGRGVDRAIRVMQKHAPKTETWAEKVDRLS